MAPAFPQYSHCLSRRCSHPRNPFGRDHCQDCGADLVVAGRFRLGEQIHRSRGTSTTITTVVDQSHPQAPHRLLKVLHEGGDAGQQQFFREQSLLQHLSNQSLGELGSWNANGGPPLPHPTVSEMIAFAPWRSGIDASLGFVMDDLRGRSLAEELERSGPPSWGRFQGWFTQLIYLVRYLHRHQIVHGDIKPSNLILQGDQLRLIDFGAAGFVGDRSPQSSFGFCPPAIANRPLTYQRDWYALGVTCIQLLTGHHPVDLLAAGTDWQTCVPNLSPTLQRRMAAWMMI